MEQGFVVAAHNGITPSYLEWNPAKGHFEWLAGTITYASVMSQEDAEHFAGLYAGVAQQDGLKRQPRVYCKHEMQEQPGEPPIDVCSSCGLVRR